MDRPLPRPILWRTSLSIAEDGWEDLHKLFHSGSLPAHIVDSRDSPHDEASLCGNSTSRGNRNCSGRIGESVFGSVLFGDQTGLWVDRHRAPEFVFDPEQSHMANRPGIGCL
jgi:hypothetical protein